MKVIALLSLALLSFKLQAVTNGVSAPYRPWVVRVDLCTGVMIHKRFVLTAAHCVYDKPANFVRVNHMQRKKAPAVKSIHVHPNYKAWGSNGIKRHDLALIELESNDELTPAVISFENNRKSVSLFGWGKMEDGKYPKSAFYIEELEVLPDYKDESWEFNKHILISDDPKQDFQKTFASGDYMAIEVVKGRSACRGDSGAALYDRDDRVVGLVSHGQDDCLNQPTFFALNIANYKDWIEKSIGEILSE